VLDVDIGLLEGEGDTIGRMASRRFPALGVWGDESPNEVVAPWLLCGVCWGVVGGNKTRGAAGRSGVWLRA